MKRTEAALERFADSIGRVPTTQEGLRVLWTDPGLDGWEGPYLPEKFAIDSWGHAFIYRVPGELSGRVYDLYSLGRDGEDNGGSGDDITIWAGYDRSCYPNSNLGRLRLKLGLAC